MNATDKRTNITMDVKLKVISAFDELKDKSKLAKRFGLKRTTAVEILKRKEKIIKAINNGMGAKRLTLKQPKNPDLEATMLNYAKRVRSQNLPLSGHILKVSLIF